MDFEVNHLSTYPPHPDCCWVQQYLLTSCMPFVSDVHHLDVSHRPVQHMATQHKPPGGAHDIEPNALTLAIMKTCTSSGGNLHRDASPAPPGFDTQYDAFCIAIYNTHTPANAKAQDPELSTRLYMHT